MAPFPARSHSQDANGGDAQVPSRMTSIGERARSGPFMLSPILKPIPGANAAISVAYVVSRPWTNAGAGANAILARRSSGLKARGSRAASVMPLGRVGPTCSVWGPQSLPRLSLPLPGRAPPGSGEPGAASATLAQQSTRRGDNLETSQGAANRRALGRRLGWDFARSSAAIDA